MFKQPYIARVWMIISLLLSIPALASCAGKEVVVPVNSADQAEAIQAQDTPYIKALEEGMKAAESAQTARISSEWKAVENTWDVAIDKLESVSQDAPTYGQAQAKIEEYRKNRDYAQQVALSSEPSTLFSRAQICKATISALMGRDPSIIKVNSQAEGIVALSYIQPDDGTEWKTRCKIEEQTVIWASDPDGRWRTDPIDSEIVFDIDTVNSRLEIQETFPDGSISENVFDPSQL